MAPRLRSSLDRRPTHCSCHAGKRRRPCGGRERSLFFKPTGGHGGKAVYRGDKVTKGVWAEIVRGGYVAQTLVRPSERVIKIDGALEPRKMDVRLYTYDGAVLLVAARLYQGQTTNFRTPGGGFAPVFVA